jgi:hypothetical protein
VPRFQLVLLLALWGCSRPRQGAFGDSIAPEPVAAPTATEGVTTATTTLAPSASASEGAAARPPPPAQEIEEDWQNAILHCDGREACAKAAARMGKTEPHIAANVRARANGADSGCMGEALMAAANDNAKELCGKAAKFAGSDADRRLILATPALAAAAWRRYERETRKP